VSTGICPGACRAERVSGFRVLAWFLLCGAPWSARHNGGRSVPEERACRPRGAQETPNCMQLRRVHESLTSQPRVSCAYGGRSTGPRGARGLPRFPAMPEEAKQPPELSEQEMRE